MKVLFLDTETTGIDTNSRLVQLAYKNNISQEVTNVFFCPPIPITFGAMAVSHITNEMVATEVSFVESNEKAKLEKLIEEKFIVVAHNLPYDKMILQNEGVEMNQSIDTLRVAMHILQDQEKYSMQYLRYSLGLYKYEREEISAHDALGDVLVLESLFFYLVEKIKNKFGIKEEPQVLKKMITLSSQPVLLKNFSFGKYKGKSFKEIAQSDKGYLQWLLNSESTKTEKEQNEDLVFTLKYYLVD